MMNKFIKWIFWIALVAVLAVYPKLFGLYYTNLFVTFAIFALFSVSFNLLLGYTGLLVSAMPCFLVPEATAPRLP